MGQQIINNGETGAVVRGKINANFSELYTGPVNRIPKYNAGGGFVPSLLFDDGTNVGIGNVTPATRLHVTSLTSDMMYLHLDKVLVADDGWLIFRGDVGGAGASYGHVYTPDGTKLAINGVNGMVLAVGNLSPAVTILPNGNVGIGTSAPTAKLHVEGVGGLIMKVRSTDPTSYTSLRLYNDLDSGASALVIDYTGSTFAGGLYGKMWVTSNAPLTFGTNNAERVRIEADGKVGIGTATPQSKLSVQTDGTAVTAQMFAVGDAGNVNGKLINMTFVTAIDAGYIQAVHKNTGYKNLALNPDGGDVGVGINTPTAKLHIADGLNAIVKITNNGTAFAELQIGNTNGELQIGFEGAAGGRMGGTQAQSPYLGTQGNKAFTFHTSNTMRMIILGNGNVGIGATSPGARLEVNSAAGIISTFMFVGDANNPRINITGTPSKMSLVTSSSLTHADLSFGTSAFADAILIKGPSGNVGIGTTAPLAKLDVATLEGTQAAILLRASGTDQVNFTLQRAGGVPSTWQYRITTGQANVQWDIGGAAVMSLTTAGVCNAVSFVPSSDIRLKENIQLLPSGLSKALQIAEIVSAYDLKDGSQRNQIGFIAQQLQMIAPEYVHEAESGMLGVNYGQMVALLYKAVGELNEKIKSN